MEETKEDLSKEISSSVEHEGDTDTSSSIKEKKLTGAEKSLLKTQFNLENKPNTWV